MAISKRILVDGLVLRRQRRAGGGERTPCIATVVAAIRGPQDVSGWVIGLVASPITLVLTAAPWARTAARRSSV